MTLDLIRTCQWPGPWCMRAALNRVRSLTAWWCPGRSSTFALPCYGGWVSLRSTHPTKYRLTGKPFRTSSTLPRRLKVTEHAGAQLGLLFGRPGAKALAGFHAEFALCDELFQIRRRIGSRIDR